MDRAQHLFLESEDGSEEGRYGCPMLIRTRLMLGSPPRLVMRCHLGWALRTDEHTARCLDTEDQNDCWQLHPERIPAVAVAAGSSSEASAGE